MVSYEDLASEVISGGGGLRAVVHCQAEEFEVAETMCKGKVEGVLVVIHNKESEKSIPMEDEKGRMIMRNVQITTIRANDIAVYSKHATTNVVKIQKETTTVLRVRFDKIFVEGQLWKQVNERAKTAFERWTHDLSLDGVVDTCGWSAEKSTGTELVVGLARVSEGAAETIIQKSGTKGCFVDPKDWKDRTWAAYRLEWLAKQKDEEDDAYLLRAVSMRPELGATAGTRQIGLRHKSKDDDEQKPGGRTWMLEGIPREWTEGMLMSMLENNGVYNEIKVLNKVYSGATATWTFKAIGEKGQDTKCFRVDDGGGPITLWFRIAPPRNTVRYVRAAAGLQSHQGQGVLADDGHEADGCL